MKVVLVHDYIKEYGGAERVLEVLHEMYPQAPVYTLLYAPEFLGPHKQRFNSWDIRTSWLQKIPFSYKFVSIFRILAPIVFQTFDFSEYDLIIVSATGAYNPNMIKKGRAKQVCYCHTPPRYLYGFATAREWRKNAAIRIAAEIANHILRLVDYQSSKHVDLFIANSRNVAARIRKFYRRDDSIVIYPPIELPRKNEISMQKKRTYFLAGGRLARPKHIDLIIEAANKKHIPLKIFGKGFAGYGDELKSLARNTVSMLGEVSDKEKKNLMRGAKAFLIAAEEEDFGMIPVEAMGYGIPIIAYKSGGLVESVIDGKTGIFFTSLSMDSLINAIDRFEKMNIDAAACRRQAEKFTKARFINSFKRAVAKALQS